MAGTNILFDTSIVIFRSLFRSFSLCLCILDTSLIMHSDSRSIFVHKTEVFWLRSAWATCTERFSHISAIFCGLLIRIIPEGCYSETLPSRLAGLSALSLPCVGPIYQALSPSLLVHRICITNKVFSSLTWASLVQSTQEPRVTQRFAYPVQVHREHFMQKATISPDST